MANRLQAATHTRRASSRTFLTSVMCASFVMLHAPHSQAALYECGPYQEKDTQHVGYTGPTPQMGIVYVQGVAANITIRRADLCGTDTSINNNFSNSYVMLKNTPDSTGWSPGWSQVGFERRATDSVRHFAQYWNGNTWDPITKGPLYMFTRYSVGSPVVGEIYSYSVRYATACDCLRTMVNSTVWQESDFSPYYSWTEPFRFEVISETRYKANDVPGYSGLSPGPTRYENVELYDYDYRWRSLPCGATNYNDNPARWNAASTSCNYLRTYTIGTP